MMKENTFTVIVPALHIQTILEHYLRDVQAVTSDQMITALGMPIVINDDETIEFVVSVMESTVN